MRCSKPAQPFCIARVSLVKEFDNQQVVNMKKYDLVVIGAGPSGYAAAMRALDFKKNVLLIEKGRVGDLTADIALVNVGELEGRHAVEKIFGRPKRKLIYENISTIMFLIPEVAGVGLNEIQAREKGM